MTQTVSHHAFVAAPNAALQADIHTACSIVRMLFGPPETRAFAVHYWDGTVETPAKDQEPSFTFIVRRPGALRRMLLPPSELALGEAYVHDDFDIAGDIEAAVGLTEQIAARMRSPLRLAQLVRLVQRLPTDDFASSDGTRSHRTAALTRTRHSRQRDAAAVRAHYDVGNAFYALWLDQRMVYSCAYFPTGAETLDEAQTAKLEHICRKLRLQPGERLLDIGCGWGGLVQYAAERYGVDALGITLSVPQAESARERIRTAGLADRCRIEVRDYRDLRAYGVFDKVVSVGMFEHVGHAKLPGYFAMVSRLVRPGGLFLNHGIAATAPTTRGFVQRQIERAVLKPGAFIDRYVFPDGELTSPGESIRIAERAGLETRDVENLREHYALTLRQWVRRLEAHRMEAIDLVGEQTYRVWRVYMAGSAHAFSIGRIQVIQALYSKQRADGSSGVPLSRADIYDERIPQRLAQRGE